MTRWQRTLDKYAELIVVLCFTTLVLSAFTLAIVIAEVLHG